jgi:hypothetical protein
MMRINAVAKWYSFAWGIVLWVGLLTVAFQSCSNESETGMPEAGVWYPIQTGSTWIYSVDSIWIDCVAGRNDTFRFQVREVMEGWVSGASGDSLMKIRRQVRSDSTQNWSLPRIWHTRIGQGKAIKTEENRSIIKLVFPMTLGLKWDGWAFLPQTAPQAFEYAEIDQAFSGYDSTALVVQWNNENLLEKQYFVERYARNTGLIYAYRCEVTGIVSNLGDPNDCSSLLPPDQPWSIIPLLKRVKFGYQYEQRLLEFIP